MDAPVRALPGAPLLAVDRAKVALVVRPFVPDADAIGLEIGDIGVAVQEPDQLVDDRFQMQALGGDQREALAQVEAQLPAEQRPDAGARPVALDRAGVERFVEKIEIGAHRRVREARRFSRRTGEAGAARRMRVRRNRLSGEAQIGRRMRPDGPPSFDPTSSGYLLPIRGRRKG